LLLVIFVSLSVLMLFGLWSRQRADSAVDSPGAPPAPLLAEQARGTSLMAIGRVVGLTQACTGWLLDVGAPQAAGAFAVTAGRCTGIDDSSTVIRGASVSGAEVQFATFAAPDASVASDPVVAPIEEVVWASTRGVDLAVLRLGVGYPELAAKGVRPIPVAAAPGFGAPILVAGVPVAVPAGQRHLRGSKCAITGRTDVLEGPWLLHDLRATDCRGILEGSLGSPALSPEGEAVGMVATTSIGAPAVANCALHRPCETGQGSVGFHPTTTYLVEVKALAGCFPLGEFRFSASCRLEDPAGVLPASVPVTAVAAGGEVEITVGAEGSAPESVQVRSGPLSETGCWQSRADSREVAVDSGRVIVTAPTQPGLALFCVGRSSQPTPLIVQVTAAANTPASIRLEQWPVPGGVQVSPASDSTDPVTFRWVVEPFGRGDCDAAEGYVAYSGEPAVIDAADLPAIVCLVAVDGSGQTSAPVSVVVK
jgi:hypothetical protein